MTKQISISAYSVTVTNGKMKNLSVDIDGKKVSIPVDEEIFAYFMSQFYRDNPSPLQKKKFATVMNLIRAAYIKGKHDK